MNNKLFSSLLFLCLSLGANAQDEFDALRYGFTQNFGSARSMSIGGATGSLGADFSSLSNNPAGLGLFRSSDFSFTPNLSIENGQSTFKSNTNETGNTKFNFNQFGIVISSAKKGNEYKKSRWKTFNVGFGMNRLANFNTDFSYSGADNQSSIIETYAQEINNAGGYTDNALNSVSDAAYAAYKTYLIDQNSADTAKVRSYIPFQEGLLRSKVTSQSGSLNEFVLSMGANYQEKLMVGATLAFPRIEYNRTQTISEKDSSPNLDNDFNFFELSEYLTTQGTGLNLKIGMIYKASESFRFGAALHSPTRYQMTDVSSVYMLSNTDSLLYRNGQSTGVTEYNQTNSLLTEYIYRSPLRGSVSASYLFQKKGFLSADVEFVDYAGMEYDYQGNYPATEVAINRVIENTFKSALNVRIGGEVKLKEMALRAGFATLGNPYQNYDGGATTYSIGTGYRGKSFYTDLGVNYIQQKQVDKTHELEREVNIPTADIKYNALNIAWTIGWRF